jgi:hypothetical protein
VDRRVSAETEGALGASLKCEKAPHCEAPSTANSAIISFREFEVICRPAQAPHAQVNFLYSHRSGMAWTTRPAGTNCCVMWAVSASPIGGLTKPRSRKQKTRKLLQKRRN